MKKKLIIFGLSNIAEVAYEYFTHDSDFEVCAFTLDEAFMSRRYNSPYGLPVVAFENLTASFSPATHHLFVAVGSQNLNRLRQHKINQAKRMGYMLASYISSKAFVWPNVIIGEHAFILENNTIQPFVKIGSNVVLWSHNHIGHASSIGDNVFVSSQVVISGHCNIGVNSFFGVNSAVGDNVKVGADNYVGMGVCINQNTDDDSVFRSIKPEKSKLAATRVFKANNR